MAESGKVAVGPEHLSGGDGTVTAMQLWSSRSGPVKHNAGQSLYLALVREGYKDEQRAEGESYSSTQKTIRKMKDKIQSELHGPDHVNKALLAAVQRQEHRDTTRLALQGLFSLNLPDRLA